MSTFNDLIPLIRFKIKDDGATYDYSDATLWMLGQEAIRMVHRILVDAGSDLVQNAASESVTSGAASLPTNFLSVVPKGFYYDDGTKSYPLTEMTYDRLAQWGDTTATTNDEPREYLVEAGAFVIRPVSSNTYSCMLYYFQTVDAYMPSGSDYAMPWNDLFNDAVVYWVVENVLNQKRIYDTSDEKSLFGEIMKLVLKALKTRGGVNGTTATAKD